MRRVGIIFEPQSERAVSQPAQTNEEHMEDAAYEESEIPPETDPEEKPDVPSKSETDDDPEEQSESAPDEHTEGKPKKRKVSRKGKEESKEG